MSVAMDADMRWRGTVAVQGKTRHKVDRLMDRRSQGALLPDYLRTGLVDTRLFANSFLLLRARGD